MCVYNWKWDTSQLEPRTKRYWRGKTPNGGCAGVWSSVSKCLLQRLSEALTANLRPCGGYLHWGHNHMAEIKLQKAPKILSEHPQAGLAFGRGLTLELFESPFQLVVVIRHLPGVGRR